MKIENIIYKMLTENTGAALCDSGGAYGRNWERNQNKKLKDFMAEPAAICDISRGYLDVSFSVFHHLINTLELDEYCEKFNKLKCDDWDGDFYGTSKKQCDWLEKHGFYISDKKEFNTYNWDSNFSQVLQGAFLKQGGYTDEYVLLQIHGGCDVRGGYTNAKLFKVANDYFLYETGYFSIDDNLTLDYFSGGDVSLHDNESGGDKYLGASELDEFCKIHDGKKFIGKCYF